MTGSPPSPRCPSSMKAAPTSPAGNLRLPHPTQPDHEGDLPREATQRATRGILGLITMDAKRESVLLRRPKMPQKLVHTAPVRLVGHPATGQHIALRGQKLSVTFSYPPALGGF